MSDADRQSIVNALKEEGISEEQLNAMAPERVWKLYVNSMTEITRAFLDNSLNSFEFTGITRNVYPRSTH